MLLLLPSAYLPFFCVGVAKDRHVVIVDDLVMTGGTLIECAKVSVIACHVEGHSQGSYLL